MTDMATSMTDVATFVINVATSMTKVATFVTDVATFVINIATFVTNVAISMIKKDRRIIKRGVYFSLIYYYSDQTRATIKNMHFPVRYQKAHIN